MYPFVNMFNKNSFTIPDSAYSSGSDLNASGGGSNVNTNKGQEIEYWAHQHQWFETGKLTTATDSSMTSLLTHTVAHSTRTFYSPKINQ